MDASTTCVGAGLPSPYDHYAKLMLTHEYTYAYAAVEAKSGELDSLILPYVNTDCMQLFLDEGGARHPSDKIVMVLDGVGWHSSRLLQPPQNMKRLTLPPYAPELNPVEHVWVDAIPTVSTPQHISQSAHSSRSSVKRLNSRFTSHRVVFLLNVLRPKADCYAYFMSEEAGVV